LFAKAYEAYSLSVHIRSECIDCTCSRERDVGSCSQLPAKRAKKDQFLDV